jgi:hypothetical protein
MTRTHSVATARDTSDSSRCSTATFASGSSYQLPGWLIALPPAGMYLGSAAAMLVLPSVSALFGAASLLRLVGLLGLAWLAMWAAVGRDAPGRRSS